MMVAIILSFIAFILTFYNWNWLWNLNRYKKLPMIKMTPIAGVGFDLLKHKEEGKSILDFIIYILDFFFLLFS